MEQCFDARRRLPLRGGTRRNRRNRLVDLNLAIGFASTIEGFESCSKTRIGISVYETGEGMLTQMIPWPENRDQCLLLFDQKALSILLNLASGKWQSNVID
jgi:hypothetical protein